MRPLTILSQAATEDLRSQAGTESGLAAYAQEEFDLDRGQFLKTGYEVPVAPSLVMEVEGKAHRASTDFENAKTVYEWLGPIEEVAASDPRLWITLTHRDFYPYMRWRWIPQSAAKARNNVLDHWFFRGGGLAAMRRNGIARLWWAAHLTSSPWVADPSLLPLKKEDPYAYTRLLLKNQDVYQGLIEREFAVNRRVLAAVLSVIGKDESARCNSAFVTTLLRELNLVSAIRDLSVVPVDELVGLLDREASRVLATGKPV